VGRRRPESTFAPVDEGSTTASTRPPVEREPDPDGGPRSEEDDPSDTESPGIPEVSIYAIQDPRHPGFVTRGSEVALRNVVVTGLRSDGCFVEDAGSGAFSGLFVVLGEGNLPAGIVLGDEVDAWGTVTESNGQTQLDARDTGAELTGIRGEVSPTLIDPVDLASAETADLWDAVLVEVDGEPILVSSIEGAAFGVTFEAAAVRVDATLYANVAGIPGDERNFAGFGVGASLSGIRGVVNAADGQFTLAPRVSTDLTGYRALDDVIDTAPIITVDVLVAGDLVISEIMSNPTNDGPCDANDGCEWFEVFNATSSTIDLTGLFVRDDDSVGTVITDAGTIPAGGFGALVRGAASASPYTAFTPVGYYGNGAALANDGDALLISASAESVVLDLADVPSSTQGVSVQLDAFSITATLNDDSNGYCRSTKVFESFNGVDELGTPGAPNDACAI